MMYISDYYDHCSASLYLDLEFLRMGSFDDTIKKIIIFNYKLPELSFSDDYYDYYDHPSASLCKDLEFLRMGSFDDSIKKITKII